MRLLSRARVNLKEILTPYIEEGIKPEDRPRPANPDDLSADGASEPFDESAEPDDPPGSSQP